MFAMSVLFDFSFFMLIKCEIFKTSEYYAYDFRNKINKINRSLTYTAPDY